jgi:folate-dependent phosphoribosylglycinamide formyltransferase PurN
VLQRTVAVPDQCTPDELAGLVFEQEKLAYPEAIGRLARGEVTICGHRTVHAVTRSPE